MRSERPLGHVEAILGLWRAARAGRLVHASIFSGPDGIGKMLAAEWLARGMLCERGPGEPCDTCGPCKRVLRGSHADVFVIDPLAEDEEEIKISRIAPREGFDDPNVRDFLSLRPMEGGWRVVLVREAERMNTAAQNALLKTLEEPGDATLLVLVTAHAEGLLPTIASRCARVDLRPLAPDDARAVLGRAGLAAADAARLARASGCAPGRALALAARGGERVLELVADVLAGRVDAGAAAAELEGLVGDFGSGTPRQQARERARSVIDLVLELVGDLCRASAGVDPAGLRHGALVEGVAHAGGLERARRERMLEAGLVARQDVEANLAPDAVLELLLNELAPARARGRTGSRS